MSVQIADKLATAIRSGELATGQRLIETELASQLSTSRGPVREALRQLAEAGLVEIMPYRGAFVANPSPPQLREMVILRAAIEGLASRFAANRGSAALEPLAAIVEDMRAAAVAGDYDELAARDRAFHVEVFRLADIEALTNTWHNMSDRINLMLTPSNPLFQQADVVVAHHQFLADAMVAATDLAWVERACRQLSLLDGFWWLGEQIPDVIDDDVLADAVGLLKPRGDANPRTGTGQNNGTTVTNGRVRPAVR